MGALSQLLFFALALLSVDPLPVLLFLAHSSLIHPQTLARLGAEAVMCVSMSLKWRWFCLLGLKLQDSAPFIVLLLVTALLLMGVL